MKAQSLEIEQLHKDLERANSANESMRDELEQLKGEAAGAAPPDEGSGHRTASPRESSPLDETTSGMQPRKRRSR